MATGLAIDGEDVRDRILEIVVFMIDNLGGEQFPPTEFHELLATLQSMGYSEGEISTAYFWFMERFDAGPESYFSNFPTDRLTNRILSDAERARFSTDAHGFVMKLLTLGIIDNEQLESIIDRASFLSAQPIALDQAKMLVSSVVFRDAELHEGMGSPDGKKGHSRLLN